MRGFGPGGDSVIALRERDSLSSAHVPGQIPTPNPPGFRLCNILHHDISPDQRSVEELQTLAELYSARRIDSGEALTDLTEDELFVRWDRVGPRQENADRIRFWHETQAEEGNAAFHYERLAQIEPNNPEWRFHLARTANGPDWRERIDAEYGRAVALGMDRVGLWLHWGGVHQDARQWTRAESDYSHALSLFPDDGNLVLLRGIVRAESGRWADAASDLERAWRMLLGGQTWVEGGLHWYDVALAHLAAGDKGRFRRMCSEQLGKVAREGKPDRFLLRACCIIPGAVEDYRPLLAWVKVAPDIKPDVEVLVDRGMVLYRAGKIIEAARALTESSKLRAADDPIDWLFLALVKRRLGAKEEAQALIEKSQAWLKKDAAAEPNLRRMEAERGLPPWVLRLQVELLLREATGPAAR